MRKHAPPRKFLDLEAMILILRQFSSQNDASWRPDDRVLHALQMRLVRLIIRLEE